MSTQTLNLGILAHIDAGKTSLTERLLFDNEAISKLGSVDGGTTTTDTSELERQRGITIRSAVASFAVGDMQVNLVDTPGHPDFIAEVERALSVLDGAVLVISAVEGVQAQTRVLMRSLKKLRLPTLLFVNKVDRMGARYDDLLAEIRNKLSSSIVPMERVSDIGTRNAAVTRESFGDERFRTQVAELLADHDDDLLGHFVENVVPDGPELQRLLVEQTAAGLVHPVFFGSALSGAGATELTDGIRAFLFPRAGSSSEEHVRGTVFAIERTSKGEKTAYIRLFSGVLQERQHVTLHRYEVGGAIEEYTGRISRLEVVGADSGRGPLTAGNIAKVRGLARARVGDRLGAAEGSEPQAHFPPPILESVVRPWEPERKSDLHAALTALADEDPLIRTRTLGGGATSVLLYGAVQQEVIGDRLEREFGIKTVFEEVQPIYFERPVGLGEARFEFDPRGHNDFWQTIGLRVEPRPEGRGNSFATEAEWGTLPRAYHRAIEEAALRTLQQGLYGWEVTDCAVILTHVGYDPPMSVAADFRNLAPLVVMRALQNAGTDVYEPAYTVEVEVPVDAVSGVIGFLTTLGADILKSGESGSAWTISGEIPARLLHDLGIALPGLAHGEGMLWHEPGSDRRVRTAFPKRERSDGNPLDYDEYLRFLANRNLGKGAAAESGVEQLK